MILHSSTSECEKAGWASANSDAQRLIFPFRAVVAEQSRPQAHWRNGAALVDHVEVDMPIVVRMKVILSPPGLILKEGRRTEKGFTPTQASAK
jgi:hypothetical protein